MNSYIDLHTHSTFSDGTLTPDALVKKAAEIGLKAIALTDHDTTEGLPFAIEAGKKYGVEVITGIEFSVENDFPMHILGLDFSLPCDPITDMLGSLIKDRNNRLHETIEKLNTLGMSISVDDVVGISDSKVLGRSHIARVLVKKGYTSSIEESFRKYLDFGKPAYASRKRIEPASVINAIKASGGKSFVAHLNQTGRSVDELYTLLSELKAFGLDGIEGYYTQYTDKMNNEYRQIASDLGLILSGGSDFHGNNKENHELGTGAGNLKIPYQILENIKNQKI